MLAPACSIITITGAFFAYLIIADLLCMRQAQRCMTSAYAISLAAHRERSSDTTQA